MAFLSIHSTNKNLSFELNKNPKSGLQAMDLREGALFGFFSKKAKSFNLYFQDHPLRCSFNEELAERGDLEYNDLTRYSSPTCYLSMLDKGVSLKESDVAKLNNTTKHQYRITLASVRLGSKHLADLFAKDLQGQYDIVAQPLADSPRFFKLTFSTEATSVYYILQVVKVFLLLASKFNDRDQKLDEMQIEKYLKEIVKLDLNYQLRNVFKVRFMTPNFFKKHKDLINTSSKVQLDLQCDNNFMQRRDFIVNTAIENYQGANIVDLGCGEGNYIKILYKKLVMNNPKEAFSYTAIDSSPEALEEVKHLVRKNEFSVDILSSLEEFISGKYSQTEKNYTFMCTEVIEHNTKEDAIKLLETLNTLRAERIIITTPNKAFNTFYNLEEEETRHHDHKYEVTEEEFKALINEAFKEKKITFYNLGDKVNGIASTLAAVIL